MIGMNEGLILSVLACDDDQSVADIARRLDRAGISRTLDDSTIYLALRRMLERDLLEAKHEKIKSSDGRTREVGFYSLTDAGWRAVAQFQQDAKTTIRAAEPPAPAPDATDESVKIARRRHEDRVDRLAKDALDDAPTVVPVAASIERLTPLLSSSHRLTIIVAERNHDASGPRPWIVSLDPTRHRVYPSYPAHERATGASLEIALSNLCYRYFDRHSTPNDKRKASDRRVNTNSPILGLALTDDQRTETRRTIMTRRTRGGE